MSKRGTQRSDRVSWSRVGTGGVAFTLGVVACLWVRSAVLPTASAQPPVAGAPPAPAVAPNPIPPCAGPTCDGALA